MGTTVEVDLPRFLGGGEAAAPGGANTDDEERGAGELVLVVEDEEDIRIYIKQTLLDLGYDVLEAMDGPAALTILDIRPDIDLLLTDVVLPGGMSGRLLADRARMKQPVLKVLFITGYAFNEIVRDGRFDPDKHVLGKPFGRAKLAAKVRAAIAPGEVARRGL